jgi:hypothetical protein
VRLICEVNDRMAESFARMPCDEPKAFMCECGALGCTARVSLTLAEYYALRADASLFALSPGHAAQVDGSIQRDERFAVADATA